MKERIQQVLEIEKQAHAIKDAAVHEAEQLPLQAEQEILAMLEKARSEAQEEARKMIADAHAEAGNVRALDHAKESAKRTEALALSNFDRAVAYVISKVAGRE
jgi:hypothetical protein